MSTDEIKTLSNLFDLMPKIEKEKSYDDNYYFNIFQLIEGYKRIEKYFFNQDTINGILNKKVDNSRIYDLIKLARDRRAHINKHNKVDKLVILQVKVDKNDITRLVDEIKDGIYDIYIKNLNADPYKLNINNRLIVNIFELMRWVVNDKSPINDFDRFGRDQLRPIINGFKYEESNINDYNNFNKDVIEVFKSEEFKKGITDLYGESIYKDFIRMITDDNFSNEEAKDLMIKTAEIDKQRKDNE